MSQASEKWGWKVTGEPPSLNDIQKWGWQKRGVPSNGEPVSQQGESASSNPKKDNTIEETPGDTWRDKVWGPDDDAMVERSRQISMQVWGHYFPTDLEIRRAKAEAIEARLAIPLFPR